MRCEPEWRAAFLKGSGASISAGGGTIGLARTHLHQLLNATAMNVVRVIARLWGEPLGEGRRKLGHFARLAPHPLSRQAVLC